MLAMLPVPDDTAPRLAGVLESCLASVSGATGPMPLRPARAAVVVLVDGLGAANLRARAGHARFLAGRMAKRDVIRTVLPSTTAAALTSLTTGRMPGEHGLVGYKVLEPVGDVLVKQLNGWDHGLLPDGWQRAETVFERAERLGVAAHAVGSRRYADSGFTRAVLRGARFHAASSIAERLAEAARLVRDGDPSLVYVYVPELDQLAHAHGWESARWLAVLESLDAELAAFAAALPPDVGLVVTADHGVIDVPAHRHVFVDRDPRLVEGVRHVGGEPRFLSLYFEPGLDDAARAALVARWREAEESRSWVMERREAVDAGLYGVVDDEVLPRIGDLLVAARSGIAYYDTREANRAPESMIGQHGSLTDEETRVPFIRLGAFAGE